MNDVSIAVISAVLTGIFSSGFMSLVMYKVQRKDQAHDLLLGLGHDRIVALCEEYIAKGYITVSQYDNLVKYLYIPYKARGGNGTGEKLVNEVKKLPVRPDDYNEDQTSN